MAIRRRTNLRGDLNLRSPGNASLAQFLIDDIAIDLGMTTEIITGDVTLVETDSTIFVDATNGTVTVTLPPASSFPGKTYNVKKIDVSANTVTIDADGTETIDDSLTQIISTQFDAVTVQSDGTEWWII